MKTSLHSQSMMSITRDVSQVKEDSREITRYLKMQEFFILNCVKSKDKGNLANCT